MGLKRELNRASAGLQHTAGAAVLGASEALEILGVD